ncbi:MAG: hypothetical protein AAF251_00910 [Pseudomonadota bacterium]
MKRALKIVILLIFGAAPMTSSLAQDVDSRDLVDAVSVLAKPMSESSQRELSAMLLSQAADAPILEGSSELSSGAVVKELSSCSPIGLGADFAKAEGMVALSCQEGTVVTANVTLQDKTVAVQFRRMTLNDAFQARNSRRQNNNKPLEGTSEASSTRRPVIAIPPEPED